MDESLQTISPDFHEAIERIQALDSDSESDLFHNPAGVVSVIRDLSILSGKDAVEGSEFGGLGLGTGKPDDIYSIPFYYLGNLNREVNDAVDKGDERLLAVQPKGVSHSSQLLKVEENVYLYFIRKANYEIDDETVSIIDKNAARDIVMRTALEVAKEIKEFNTHLSSCKKFLSETA